MSVQPVRAGLILLSESIATTKGAGNPHENGRPRGLGAGHPFEGMREAV